MSNRIFVFGSNLAGIHGAGSAKHAYLEHGAVYGRGIGMMDRSYAIPTKDRQLQALSLEEIAPHVWNFVEMTRLHPYLQFDVVKVGCGLAGYSEEQMAPLFSGAPENCHLPSGWRERWG